MKPKHLALALAVNLFWGGNFVAVKLGVTHFEPFFFSALRFGLLALLMLPWLRLQPGQMKRILVVGLTMGVLHFALFFSGMRLAGDVSSVAIVVQLYVPFATLLAVVFLGERIGWRRGLSIAVAFVGVLVIAFDARAFQYADALMIITVGAFVFAVGQVQMRGLVDVGVLALQGWINLIAAPVMLAISLAVEDGQMAALTGAGAPEFSALLYSTLLGSLVGHGAAYFLITRYPVSTVAPMFLLTPLVGILAGVAILGDVVTVQIAMGGALVIGAVAVITVRGARKGAEPVVETAP